MNYELFKSNNMEKKIYLPWIPMVLILLETNNSQQTKTLLLTQI